MVISKFLKLFLFSGAINLISSIILLLCKQKLLYGHRICFSYNKVKYTELPYHAFKIDQQLYPTTLYLTDLSWIYNKLNATGCVHILNDIYIVEQLPRTSSTIAPSTMKHILLLWKFLELHIRPLNYDARQFYSLIPAYVRDSCELDDSLATDAVISKWLEHFKAIPIPYLETLLTTDDTLEKKRKESGANEATVTVDATPAKTLIGYDVITNLGGDGYFVASLSVDREEICVWDVPRCMKVRTLTGIPQPTALCPVGDYGAAVLCRREIKVIDLNEGAFKVTSIFHF